MKTLNNISRYIVGIVFIFSGIVKAVDPLGFNYKFIDYLESFGMDFFSFLALPLAILLSALEFTIGFSLIFATKKKLTVWALTIFMCFFTILTFILALFNPVTDCGCFGDAIIMTNWETFGKNVILMIFTIVLFYNRNKFEIEWKSKIQWIIVSLPFIFSVAFSVYCYNNLPVLDFRPYSIGTYIPEKMSIPEDAPKAEYETILKYQKNGEIKEFTLENFPDSTWEWVSTDNIKISDGYIPPIHDFTIQTSVGNDITEVVLNDDKFTFLLIAYNLKNTSTKNIKPIIDLSLFAKESGRCNFICLTSSVESDINEFKEKTNVPFVFYTTDEITLKTIIRSNPGIVLLKKGIILGKWHHNNTPSPEEIQKDFLDNPKFQIKEEGLKEEVLAEKI